MWAVPSDPILVTERLVLRPLTPQDLDALHSIQSDAEHMRFYPHPFSRDETADWIERRRGEVDERGHSLWAVQDRVTGEFLGNVGPTRTSVDGLDEVELGWSITPARAREGIASEAAAACRDWCWANLAIDHVISLIRPENEASRGVAERIGMTVWKETIYGDAGWTHLVYRVDRVPTTRSTTA
jgi:[ribosomal protein S5]-alanine N-acetyltransferase